MSGHCFESDICHGLISLKQICAYMKHFQTSSVTSYFVYALAVVEKVGTTGLSKILSDGCSLGSSQGRQRTPAWSIIVFTAADCLPLIQLSFT